MALADEIAHDYEVMDGIEDVTLTPENTDGVPAAMPAIKALRLPLDKRLVGTGTTDLQLTADDVIFNLWKATMTTPSYQPKNGDKITAADGNWRILWGRLETLGTRWYCPARKHV